jgi:hypothetical protein
MHLSTDSFLLKLLSPLLRLVTSYPRRLILRLGLDCGKMAINIAPSFPDLSLVRGTVETMATQKLPGMGSFVFNLVGLFSLVMSSCCLGSSECRKSHPRGSADYMSSFTHQEYPTGSHSSATFGRAHTGCPGLLGGSVFLRWQSIVVLRHVSCLLPALGIADSEF